MGLFHTVRQGDHLSRIASKHGFRSYLTIWDDPGNAALRQLRADPHVLLPGDVVFIPDKEPRVEPGATGARHVFRTRSPRLRLRIAVLDHSHAPVAGAAGELEVGGDARAVTTDGGGLAGREIAPDADFGRLALDAEEPLELRIGHLDPVEALSGLQARLNNLGYRAGFDPEPTEALRSAIEELQCDLGLPVTGVADAATRARLLEVHGC